MKVYIVEECIAHEGCTNIAVFASEENAWEMAGRLQKDSFSFVRYTVAIMEVEDWKEVGDEGLDRRAE